MTNSADTKVSLRRDGGGGYVTRSGRWTIRPIDGIGSGVNNNGGWSNGRREWIVTDTTEQWSHKGLGPKHQIQVGTLGAARDFLAAVDPTVNDEPERPTKAEFVYRVRKQTSGYTGRDSYIVVMLRQGQPASRVTVHAHSTRESAQADADDLNIGAMVTPYDEDPRPYAERRADAERRYRDITSPTASLGDSAPAEPVYEYRVMYRHYDGTVIVYGEYAPSQGSTDSGDALERAQRHLASRSRGDDRAWWIERRPIGTWERV